MDSENRFQEFGKMITAMQNDFKTLGGINTTIASETVSQLKIKEYKIEVKELNNILKEYKDELEESNRIQDELFNETKRQEKLIVELYDSKDDLYKVVKTLIEENTALKSSVEYYEQAIEIMEDEEFEREDSEETCSCCEDE